MQAQFSGWSWCCWLSRGLGGLFPWAWVSSAADFSPGCCFSPMSVIFWFKWGSRLGLVTSAWPERWVVHAQSQRSPTAVHHSHPGDKSHSWKLDKWFCHLLHPWPPLKLSIRASSPATSFICFTLQGAWLVALVFLCLWVPKSQRGAQPSVFVQKLGILPQFGISVTSKRPNRTSSIDAIKPPAYYEQRMRVL